MTKRSAPRKSSGKLKVVYAYMETFWTEHLDRDKYEHVRLGADLPLSLGSVRAFAERDETLSRRIETANLTFPDGVSEPKAVSAILGEKPDVAAFSVYIWNAPGTDRVAKALKARSGKTRIVVGGPEVPRGEEALRRFLGERPFVDAAVSGEGEEAFAELLKAYAGGRTPEGIRGVAWRGGGSLEVNGPREPLDDLSIVPSPYLTGAVKPMRSETRMVCVETSRGCPFRCAYCDYFAGRRKPRLFPIERLERELKALNEQGFTGCVYIADPFLNLKKDRTLQVFKVLQRWKNRFHMELHAEQFDDETISELGRIPQSSVALGVQSTNAETLKNIERRFDVEKATRNIRRMLEFPSIMLDLELILGLPGDDYRAFRRTMDWALSFKPLPQVTLFDLVMLPNSPLARMKEKYKMLVDPEGLVRANYSFSSDDLMKASWLFAAYCYLRNTQGFAERLRELLQKGDRRPSDVLEKVGRRLVESGYLPKERVIGQGGRRPDPRAKKQGKPKRWVELSQLKFGVEAEAWW